MTRYTKCHVTQCAVIRAAGSNVPNSDKLMFHTQFMVSALANHRWTHKGILLFWSM